MIVDPKIPALLEISSVLLQHLTVKGFPPCKATVNGTESTLAAWLILNRFFMFERLGEKKRALVLWLCHAWQNW